MSIPTTHNRSEPSTRATIMLAVCLCLICTAALSQEAEEYQPQFQKIVYRSKVPAAIRRAAKKAGATRFFGTFTQNGQNYALHFYDSGRVRANRQLQYAEKFERSSRLDAFQLTAQKTWRKVQSFGLIRVMGDRRDKTRVEAQSLWLNPKEKTLPLIYLKVMDNYPTDSSVPRGNRTDIYGVLGSDLQPQNFIAFNGVIPYSNITVIYSEISHPDAKGNLTLLAITSDPGETSYIAYGWNGSSWKTVASTSFENRFETALRWNGTAFVPLKSTE